MPASFNTRALTVSALLAFAATANAQQANYVTSYIVQPNGNQTAINDGGTIPFPSTNLNTTSSASFVIFNSRPGRGQRSFLPRLDAKCATAKPACSASLIWRMYFRRWQFKPRI